MLRIIAITKRVLGDALGHFNYDDGWALSSHIALSALLALFPFLIFATSLASFLGAQAFADTAVHLIFDTWPDAIAAPIAREVENVLTLSSGLVTRKDRQGNAMVAVYDPATEQIEPRKIEIGLNNNVMAEIKSGLSEGEQVVSGGAPALRQGGQAGGGGGARFGGPGLRIGG